MKTFTPSPHYSIRLPDDVHLELDEEVFSAWRKGDSTVLQLSSRFRESGKQVSAAERLRSRMKTTTTIWSPLTVGCDTECEVAAASTTDDGYVWWHIYLVVPTTAVYATVSFPSTGVVNEWAVDAIRSIRFGNPIVTPV